MSLSCDASDSDGSYVEVGEQLLTSAVSFKCFECHKEIPSFYPFHMVRVFRYADEDDWENGLADEEDEVDISNSPCCEVCADLGSSILELGYCWSFGSIRNDIADMND